MSRAEKKPDALLENVTKIYPMGAEEVHALIRSRLGSLYSDAVAGTMRIQYGGSVKPDNAAELFSQANIDGGLIGGASLDAESFAAIVTAAV